MIYFVQGNIFDSGAEALVNPVNCVGVMGKGLALEFKNRFPENYEHYREACKNNEIFIGKMFINYEKGIYIINFPTKLHWKNESKYEWIEKGLDQLPLYIDAYQLKSIAIPALGCGNGGLSWNIVRSIIESGPLGNSKSNILVYEPEE